MSDETGHGDCGDTTAPFVICRKCGLKIEGSVCYDNKYGQPYHFACIPCGGSNEQVSPDHYRTGDIECVDALRSMLGDEGFVIFCRGVIAQYLWRFGRKDDPLMEISKIQVYARWIKDTLDGKALSK